jgi:type IV secretory pathway TrbD component
VRPGRPEDWIYIVTGDGGRLVVALDEPIINGQKERAESEGIVELDLLPQVVTGFIGPEMRESTISGVPPGLADERNFACFTGVLAALVGFAVCLLMTALVGVPVGLLLGVAAYVRYLRHKALIAARWEARHRTLEHYDDKSLFNRALTAAKTILASWPHIRPLVQVQVPQSALVASLWSLTGLLGSRAELRTQQESLQQAQVDLPAGAAVGQQVADRLARVEESIADLEAEINRRIESFEGLAAECVAFIQAEQAIARAREAIRRADRSLGEIAPAAIAPRDPTEDLGEQIRAIMTAYRQLTGVDPG